MELWIDEHKTHGRAGAAHICCIDPYQHSSRCHKRDSASPASRLDATRDSCSIWLWRNAAAPAAVYCIVCTPAAPRNSNSRSSRRSSLLTCLGWSTCRGLGALHRRRRLVVSRRLYSVGTVPDVALLQVVAAVQVQSARRGGRRSRRPSACMVLWAGSHQRWGSRSGSGRLDSSRRSGGVVPLASPHGAARLVEHSAGF